MSARINHVKLSHKLYTTLYSMETQLAESPLDKTILHLVKLRASQLNGCLFCLDMHSKESRLSGERELRLHHLAVWYESPQFSEKEKAALEWTEHLTQISAEGISDDLYEKIAAHFSDQELSDLTFAIGAINMWNRLGVAFRPEPGSLDKTLGLDKSGVI